MTKLMKYFDRTVLFIVLFALIQGIIANATLNDVDRQEIFSKNLIKNGGFENGKAGWTASGGTFLTVTSGTNLLTGQVSFTWDSSSASQTLSYSAVTIPKGLYSKNGVATCKIQTPSGTATHKLIVFDGTNTIASQSISSSSTPQYNHVNFVFPSSGTIQLKLLSVASDEPLIAGDDCGIFDATEVNTMPISQQITDWQDFPSLAYGTLWTTTGTAAAYGNSGSPTIHSARLRRVGSNLEIEWDYRHTVAGTAGTGMLLFNLPAGYTINTALKPANSGTTNAAASYDSKVGTFNGFMAGPVTFTGAVMVHSTTQLKIQINGHAAASNGPGYFGGSGNYDFASNAAMSLHFTASVPIVEFSGSTTGYRAPQSANSYSGYHDNTCAFSRTGTTYADPTADTTCALTERVNRNFGTVTSYKSGADFLPGIVFTPTRAGQYFVCANMKYSQATASARAGFRLTDGTSTIAESQVIYESASASSSRQMCGLYLAASTAAKTLSIQMKSTSGAVIIQSLDSGYNEGAIDWTIVAVDQSLPAPYLNFGDSYNGVNLPGSDSVVTTTQGVQRFKVASNGQLSAVVPGGSTLYPAYMAKAIANIDTSTTADIVGSYARSGTDVTVTMTAHGLSVGHAVHLDFTTGTATDGTYVVTSVTSANVFNVTHPASGSTSGAVTGKFFSFTGGNVAKVSASSGVAVGTAGAIQAGMFIVNYSTAMPNATYVFGCTSAAAGGRTCGLSAVGGALTDQDARTAQTTLYTKGATILTGNTAVDLAPINIWVF